MVVKRRSHCSHTTRIFYLRYLCIMRSKKTERKDSDYFYFSLKGIYCLHTLYYVLCQTDYKTKKINKNKVLAFSLDKLSNWQTIKAALLPPLPAPLTWFSTWTRMWHMCVIGCHRANKDKRKSSTSQCSLALKRSGGLTFF